MKKGIDISKWQGDIDFGKVAADGVEFVILREGYRRTVDPKFHEYVSGARQAGIPVAGVYHFSYALNAEDAVEEARSCIEHVREAGLSGAIIFYDFEYDTVDQAKEKGVILSRAECVSFTQAFCDYVKSQGYRAGVYTNMDYYRRMYTPEIIGKYVLWLADYAGEPDLPCLYQQYSSTGKVSGIVGNVDMDYCYMDDAPVKEHEPLLAEKVIRIAKAEVGYLEKGSSADLYDKTANAGNSNYTKYGKEMHDLYPEVMDYPAAWCDAFVDWCFYNAYGVANAKALLGGNFDDYTVSSAQLYRNKGAWHEKDPRPGDQIFFTNGTRISHTGLVVSVDDFRVYTVEGNTSSGAEVIANGGAVCEKSYLLTNSRIAGYGRPAYDTSKPTPITPGWKQAADGVRWWYQYADGTYPAGVWALIDHYWYLFDADGYMLTGWQQWDGKEIGKGDWYYLDTTKGSTEGQCWHEKPGGKGALGSWYVEVE